MKKKACQNWDGKQVKLVKIRHAYILNFLLHYADAQHRHSCPKSWNHINEPQHWLGDFSIIIVKMDTAVYFESVPFFSNNLILSIITGLCHPTVKRVPQTSSNNCLHYFWLYSCLLWLLQSEAAYCLSASLAQTHIFSEHCILKVNFFFYFNAHLNWLKADITDNNKGNKAAHVQYSSACCSNSSQDKCA